MDVSVFISMKAFAIENSPIHRRWSAEDFNRLLRPAIENDQYVLTDDGFCTWAWLSNDAFDGFIKRTRKLQPKDWVSGQNLTMIDLVARGGHAKDVVREVRKKFPRGQVALATKLGDTGQVERVARWANA